MNENTSEREESVCRVDKHEEGFHEQDIASDVIGRDAHAIDTDAAVPSPPPRLVQTNNNDKTSSNPNQGSKKVGDSPVLEEPKDPCQTCSSPAENDATDRDTAIQSPLPEPHTTVSNSNTDLDPKHEPLEGDGDVAPEEAPSDSCLTCPNPIDNETTDGNIPTQSPSQNIFPTKDDANGNSDPTEDCKEDIDETSAAEDDPKESCPICLNLYAPEEFVSGPCGHSLSAECMELLLNARADVERWPPPSAADGHLSAPTLGRCPICRAALSLFDIVYTKTQKPLYPLDTESWKPVPTGHEEKVDEEAEDEKSAGEEEPHPAKELIDTAVASLSEAFSTAAITTPKHPLRNAVYIPYRGSPGELSFHWDWEKVRSHDEETSINQRPFLNLTRAVQKRPEFWRLDDQTFARPIQFMEEGCHFHEPSRTFHGTVRWPVPLKGAYEWDIILGFSKDYRFISSGRIHHKRGRKLNPGDVPDSYTEKERELCKHPMDGRWTVVWNNRDGEERRNEIHVINNQFKQSGWSFYFNFQDPSRVFVHWPRSRHRQTIVEGIDLMKEPLGPPVGQRIRWETSDPNAPDLIWIRQTIGPNPVEHVHNYGMGQGKFLYQRMNADISDSIPTYNGDSVFGNVFIKRLYVGSASYHFVSPTESYLSYRHPACRDLPPMDDGSPLPTRVDFHNVEWDPEARKLTATIEWEKDFGTSWNDNVRWKLTMHFDSEYMIILKGGIQCEWCKERRARPRPPRPLPRHRPTPVPVYVPPPEPTDENGEEEQQQQPPTPTPDRNEEWVMSGYGHDQLYVNAACLERYRIKGGEEAGGEAEETPAVDYRALFEQHQKRLEKEGATKRSIGFLSHLFQLAHHDDENPIDFLI